MTRYVPSRRYRQAALGALALGTLAAWYGWEWAAADVIAALFLASAVFLMFLAFCPPIEIHETHLTIGRRHISWLDIRRLDRSGWSSPLIVNITLFDGSRILLIYPGDRDSINSLLRHLRRLACEALIDGIPYRQFWSEAMLGIPEAKPPASPRHHLLRPEDEAEVERLFQRLKTVRRLDSDNSTDEK